MKNIWICRTPPGSEPGGVLCSCSLLVRDAELAKKLSAGFEELWNKAMRSLNEVRFDPRGEDR